MWNDKCLAYLIFFLYLFVFKCSEGKHWGTNVDDIIISTYEKNKRNGGQDKDINYKSVKWKISFPQVDLRALKK